MPRCRAYLALLVLAAFPADLASGQEKEGRSFCNQLSTFDYVEQFFTSSQTPANLDFSAAYPNLLEVKKNIGAAIDGVDYGVSKALIEIPTILPI